MKKELVGEKDWVRGIFRVIADDVPTKSMIGRIQIHSTGLVCIKTRAQAEWLVQALSEAIDHAWGEK